MSPVLLQCLFPQEIKENSSYSLTNTHVIINPARSSRGLRVNVPRATHTQHRVSDPPEGQGGLPQEQNLSGSIPET